MDSSLKTLLGLCGAIVLLGFLAHIGAVIAWADLHSGLAGWVQAIGAIGAIYGAFAVGNSQIRAARVHDAERRRQEVAERVKIIMALTSNAAAVCNHVKSRFDEVPLPRGESDAVLFLACRDNLARIDPFMIPSHRLVVRVLGVPLQLQRLYDAYIALERSLGMGPQRGRTEDFLNELDQTILMTDDVFRECRALLRAEPAAVA